MIYKLIEKITGMSKSEMEKPFTPSQKYWLNKARQAQKEIDDEALKQAKLPVDDKIYLRCTPDKEKKIRKFMNS